MSTTDLPKFWFYRSITLKCENRFSKFLISKMVVYKLVLTGGPCGGKTSCQPRVCSFFESIGWTVYRVPETASILLGGGVRVSEFSSKQTYAFQECLIKTMMCIEKTYFTLSSNSSKNCLIICDRGIMDALVYMNPGDWEKMKEINNWNDIELRDSRYDQVVHLVSSACGAEQFYQTENNCARQEGIEEARKLDQKTLSVWNGHPHLDIIGNETEFDHKIQRLISRICDRLGIETFDRLEPTSIKRKFLIRSNQDIPCKFEEFEVIIDHLVPQSHQTSARIRKRGNHNNFSYTHTIDNISTQISKKEYKILLKQRDENHVSVFKRRKCFIWENQYFQLDQMIFPQSVCILETYTSNKSDQKIPFFLESEREVTNKMQYATFNLSKK